MKKILIALAALMFTSGHYTKPVEVTVEPMRPKGIEIVAHASRESGEACAKQVPIVELQLFEDEMVVVSEPSEYDLQSISALAHVALGEYSLIDTPEHKMQCAAVMECVMWRVMAGSAKGFNSTVEGVCSQPYQFHGYKPYDAVSDELLAFAADVYARTNKVLNGADPQEVGCVLPTDYLWFYGTGRVNVFRNAYEGGTTWDWSWPNPYANE